VTDDDYIDVLDELREASMAYEDAFADCPPDGRLTSRKLREAADRLQDVSARYSVAHDGRRVAS
jgi:hypothetical protein